MQPSGQEVDVPSCILYRSASFRTPLDAVRLFGASGYVSETGLERDVCEQRRRRADLFRYERHPAQYHRQATFCAQLTRADRYPDFLDRVRFLNQPDAS